MTKKEIVDSIIKNGGVMIKEVTVKNVTVRVKENYAEVCLTLDRNVPGMKVGENGTSEPGETNIVWTTSIAVEANLKNNRNTAFVANHVNRYPMALEQLLSYAKINIIQELVTAGQEYTDPWSSKEKTVVFQKDQYKTHLVDIVELSEVGQRALDKISDKSLGL